MPQNHRSKNVSLRFSIQAYIEIGIVTNFLSKKSLYVKRKRKDLFQKFEYYNKRLDLFEKSLKEHCKDIVFDKQGLCPVEILSKEKMTDKYKVFLYASFIYRVARLVLHQSEVVHYSLSPIQLARSKASKAVCIDTAIEIASLLTWSSKYLHISHSSVCVCYAAYCAGSVLLNALKLYDHPNHKQIKKSYLEILDVLKFYSKSLTVSSDYDNALRYNYSIYLKSLAENKKYLDSFPELKISHLTNSDVNVWFVTIGVSPLSYLCCSVNSVCPKYNYIFVENWFKPEIMSTRKASIPDLSDFCDANDNEPHSDNSGFLDSPTHDIKTVDAKVPPTNSSYIYDKSSFLTGHSESIFQIDNSPPLDNSMSNYKNNFDKFVDSNQTPKYDIKVYSQNIYSYESCNQPPIATRGFQCTPNYTSPLNYEIPDKSFFQLNHLITKEL
ncbi:hypothetical protein AYI69_g11417 [Smittium culicis]|uniref:Uncharacterized protein n=1 Tax=Smittium culicis TaxID=133412 RepID=A0A1R1WYV5_9FUNG|nr:hypothetical protein AYI69_g11417 [Smittium culicis]